MKRVACLLASLVATTSAHADFQRWSDEVNDDPFTGGRRVVIDYMSTLRSGVIIFCDSAKVGIRIRAVAGFAYVPALDSYEPLMEFAFDGKKLLEAKGATGAVGDNIAVAEVSLTGELARTFVQGFAGAQRQIAVKDGISDQPHLLRASGSTKSGRTLMTCLDKQVSE